MFVAVHGRGAGISRYVNAMIAGTPVDMIAEFFPALQASTHRIAEPCGTSHAHADGNEDKLIPKAHNLVVERFEGGGAGSSACRPEAGHMVLLEARRG